ncbi:YtxH domain-containing protein [Myxococcus sp. K38C18041901]|uniref:YtxH domain-containing protein n=1 Tax=Myxococcus guangdongensis TaxID=2906760 RepID=UPI0020A7F208|nr:YtxH domain-containing protein [Myxococcus guangdongensis]MCP3061723.1 YtxH domain-containing protein [Myxococcus guangdongensis]
MFAKKKAKWTAKGLAKSELYRKWVAHKLLDELPRVAKDRWDDFEPDDALRHIGLTTYKPARSGLGGLGLFLIGAVAGGVAALLLTPKTGDDLRTTVKDKAMGYMNKQNIGLAPEKSASA